MFDKGEVEREKRNRGVRCPNKTPTRAPAEPPEQPESERPASPPCPRGSSLSVAAVHHLSSPCPALVQLCSSGRKTVPFQHQTLSSVLSSLQESVHVLVERLLGNHRSGVGGGLFQSGPYVVNAAGRFTSRLTSGSDTSNSIKDF